MNSGKVARGVGELGNVDILPTAFGGHCFYVLKCVQGDMVDGDHLRRQVGCIEIPQCVVDRSMWVEVLGLGPKVGQHCSKMHSVRHRRRRCLADLDKVELGWFLLCPNMHESGILRSPLFHDEFFIEESVPHLYVKPSEVDNV